MVATEWIPELPYPALCRGDRGLLDSWISGRQRGSVRTFFAWLAGNLFVGAQMTWILRPFFGAPTLEIQFLRPNPLDGSFYETVFRAT